MAIFENTYTKMWVQEGILYSIYKPIPHLTSEIAKVCVQARLDFSEGKTYPLFGDIRLIRKMDKDARGYLSSGDGIKYLNSGAFIINSPVEKMLINFWTKIDKPPLPVRVFNDEQSAIEWLKQYVPLIKK